MTFLAVTLMAQAKVNSKAMDDPADVTEQPQHIRRGRPAKMGAQPQTHQRHHDEREDTDH